MIKNEKLRNIINLIFISIFFLGFALTFLSPKFYGLTEIYVGVLVFLIYGVLFITNVDFVKLIKEKNKDFFILVGVMALTGINLLLVKSGLGAFFVAADFLLCFYLFDKINLTEKGMFYFKVLYVLLFSAWIFFAYPSFFRSENYYAYNTNTAATFSIYTFLCCYFLLEELAKKYDFMKVVNVILFVRVIRLAIWHRARGALIMIIVFMILKYGVMEKILKSKALYRILLLFSTLGSLCFVAFYTVLGTTGFNANIPFFYKDLFSGREEIWAEFYKHFAKNPILGTGTNFEIESFIEFNVHNAMYNLLIIYGIVVFIGIMYFVFKTFTGFQKKTVEAFGDKEINPLVVTGFSIIFAVLIESFFDVDLIWPDYSLNVLFILMMTLREMKNK